MAIIPFGNLILDLAMKQLGKPYVWAAAGPNAFDCSGLCMWLYGQLAHIEIPHNDEAQWNWWGQHPELAARFRYQDLPGPDALMPGDYIWCEFEGGSGNGHEMIYVGSPRQSKYANPAWPYTYLQAPQTGDVVKLSEFVWGRRDTAHGGARGLRFGRFAQLKYPPGMTPKTDRKEEEMGLAQVEKVLNAGEAWETSGFVLETRKARTDLDLINRGTAPMNVSVGIQKPNGDFGAYYITVPVSKGDPGKTQGMKNLEVGEAFHDKNLGNIIVWIHVDQPATVVKSQELL